MNTVVIKSLDKDHIRRAVKTYATQLRKNYPEILRVFWFGSWITGLPAPGSDVDLCLIIFSSNQAPRDRISKYLPLGFPTGVDLFVYTQEEFDHLRNDSPGWYEAIQSGIEI